MPFTQPLLNISGQSVDGYILVIVQAKWECVGLDFCYDIRTYASDKRLVCSDNAQGSIYKSYLFH